MRLKSGRMALGSGDSDIADREVVRGRSRAIVTGHAADTNPKR
ncbi:MAG: hypothetical protein AB7G68_08535 [Nitrospiraceae bacterium]